MSEFITFLYCAATGFVVAGVIASFYQLLTLQTADFLVAQRSVTGHIMAVLLSMFAGPVILASKVMIICPHCSQPTRVRHGIGGDGRSERICTNCGETLSGEARKESRKK